jgi:hypothetical protein
MTYVRVGLCVAGSLLGGHARADDSPLQLRHRRPICLKVGGGRGSLSGQR